MLSRRQLLLPCRRHRLRYRSRHRRCGHLSPELYDIQSSSADRKKSKTACTPVASIGVTGRSCCERDMDCRTFLIRASTAKSVSPRVMGQMLTRVWTSMFMTYSTCYYLVTKCHGDGPGFNHDDSQRVQGVCVSVAMLSVSRPSLDVLRFRSPTDVDERGENSGLIRWPHHRARRASQRARQRPSGRGNARTR